VAQEVFAGPGQLSMWAFRRQGNLLGFDFTYAVHDTFKSYDDAETGNITNLKVFGEKAGMLPSNKTLVFVKNHDTERGDTALSYRDGDTNLLADKLMLAYGRPARRSCGTHPAGAGARAARRRDELPEP